MSSVSSIDRPNPARLGLEGFAALPVRHLQRTAPVSDMEPARRGEEGARQLEAARSLRVMASWPGYEPTPLRRLPALAQAAGVRDILYKDEASRFGLASFKGMGAAYALSELIGRGLEMTGEPYFHRLRRHLAASGLQGFTVACATDGNHGRALAWAAKSLGIRAVIFLHEHVSYAREVAIASQGAEVRRVPGTYDDSVREAARQAARNGWEVVSDTSYPGYETVPADVMRGYMGMGAEILSQLPGDRSPTHVIAQAGVGSFAAAMFAYFRSTLPRPPVCVAVEPSRAACLYHSAEAGKLSTVPGELDTIMAGLACGEPSKLAWDILEQIDCHFLVIEDGSAALAMKLLASVAPPIIAGESGAAGLAGLLSAAFRPELRDSLALDRNSVVLLFGTEGATDPQSFEAIVGRRAEEISADEGGRHEQ